MIVRMNVCSAGADRAPLLPGVTYDLPIELAKRMLSARDGLGRPAASLVTDMAERAKAERYKPLPVQEESESE